MSASWSVVEGDCRETLATLAAGSVQTCVTSPPYFGLRDYGHADQIGAEASPDEFVAALVEVFREVRRVLRDDGTVWLNLGDSYATTSRAPAAPAGDAKPKDLLGIPWMVAFALRADGWWLRMDIIWEKPNPMPESVTDRPTKAHEYIFLLSKGPRYFYDYEAIREEPVSDVSDGRRGDGGQAASVRLSGGLAVGSATHMGVPEGGRNKRSVWTVSTKPYAGAHFATFPPDLIEPCILAGSRPGDVVLDPFAGSGTTGVVALRHSRSFVGCELNPEYVNLARERIIGDSPLLNTCAEVAA